jgi:hypothetical protein
VTQDRARKRAVRARMAASGEPYSVAARKVPAGDGTALDQVIARLEGTLPAPSARLEFRSVNSGWPREQHLPRRPGLLGRLVDGAAKSAWTRLVPEEIRAQLRAGMEVSRVEKGLAEPAARRYRLTGRWAARVRIGGTLIIGRPGNLLSDTRRAGSGDLHPKEGYLERGTRIDMADVVPLRDPLKWLTSLLDATDARYAGEETLRGTPCRKVIVNAGPAETTIWIDQKHVRQVQALDAAEDGNPSRIRTIELWDFGVPVAAADWTRFPSGTDDAKLPG